MELRVKNLHLRRGNRLLIKDLSFKLRPGESLQLSGPNGVGKTTLIRAIAGFITPNKGHIATTKVAHPEQEQSIDDQLLHEKIHYIGHKNGIRTSLTVLENLEFWANFYTSKTPLGKIAQKYSLKNLLHIPAGYLSQGQKRRLGLSRLSMSKRPLWLLDEPTVSLDQISVKLIVDEANQHLQNGGLLIAATHIPLEIPFTQSIKLSQPIDQEWEALI